MGGGRVKARLYIAAGLLKVKHPFTLQGIVIAILGLVLLTLAFEFRTAEISS